MGKQVDAGFSYGGVAQLGEHLPCKQGVKSSNLSISICAGEKKRAHQESGLRGKFTFLSRHEN